MSVMLHKINDRLRKEFAQQVEEISTDLVGLIPQFGEDDLEVSLNQLESRIRILQIMNVAAMYDKRTNESMEELRELYEDTAP